MLVHIPIYSNSICQRGAAVINPINMNFMNMNSKPQFNVYVNDRGEAVEDECHPERL